jgi:hypothetical protein
VAAPRPALAPDPGSAHRVPASAPLGRPGAHPSLARPTGLAERSVSRGVPSAVPGGRSAAGVDHTAVASPHRGLPRSSGLAVDRTAWAAWLDGELLDLTYLEFEVLDFLVRHPGRVYSRAALLRHVWGHEVDDDPGQAGRTVDVLVTRLRRKLGPEHRFRVETVRRVGYRYRPAAADRLA